VISVNFAIPAVDRTPAWRMPSTATRLRSSQTDKLLFIKISPHILAISQKITKVYLPAKVADVVTDEQNRRRVKNEEEQRPCNAMSQMRRALLSYERDLERTEGSGKLYCSWNRVRTNDE
jgi:hypothetical protein